MLGERKEAVHITCPPSWPRQVPNPGVTHMPGSINEALQCIVQGHELIPLPPLGARQTSPWCPVSYSSPPHPSQLACHHISQRNRQARVRWEVRVRFGWSLFCLCRVAHPLPRGPDLPRAVCCDFRASCRSLWLLLPLGVHAASGHDQKCGGGEVLQALKSGSALTSLSSANLKKRQPHVSLGLLIV